MHLRKLFPYLIGIVAGISLALSQQPYGLWPLVFVSLICFASLLNSFRENRSQHDRLAFCFGWIIYASWMCMWMAYFGTFALIAFVIFEFILLYSFVSYIAGIKSRLSSHLTYAFAWVAFEWLTSHLPILSFSWLSIATTMVNVSFVRNLARVGGGALITFLIVLIASWVASNLRKQTISWKRLLIQGAIACLCILLLGGLANIRLGSRSTSVSVAIVQGNDKNRYLTEDEIDDHYLNQSHLSLAESIQQSKDIIVFPESAFDTNPENDSQLHKKLAAIAKNTSRVMILNTIAQDGAQEVNRNFFYSPTMKLLGTYDKRRLVPFGEYVPLEQLIGSWSVFDPIRKGFTPGRTDTTIRNVTTLICYESTFTDDVRRALGRDSMLLVVTTNNRSYRRSGNSQQHLAQSQLRASEYGISVIHASVSGISAFIERDGSLTKQTKLFERTVLSGSISFGEPDSLYSKTGDWLSLLALFVVGYLSLIQLRKFRWKNQTSTD